MQQRPMPRIAFTMMTMIMALRRGGRKIVDTEMAAVDLGTGDVVLDFGCGPGYNTIPAAQQIGPQGKVFAVDVTPQALSIVKKKAAAQQLTNITTRLTGCNTGLDNASIDVVLLHNVLPMTECPLDILREIARVLKPGGRLSYKSGGGARRAARNTMTDAEVGAYLERELGFTVQTRKGGHVIFERH
jgi:ubiquinone/menaquinone biosynthesis C-methylase UbiE